MAEWSVSSVSALKSAVSQAANGDTIRIQAGTYHITDSAGILVSKSLTFVGEGGRADFQADVNVTKGIFTVQKQVGAVTFDGIGFFDAANNEGNGAGIRHQGGNLTVRDSFFANNEDGILGIATAGYEGDVRIFDSEFRGNGSSSGLAHGIYIKSDTLLVEGSTFRDTDTGHHIKSLSASTVVRGNLIDDGTGNASRAIDVTAGGDLLVEGNRIIKSAAADNTNFIYYADTRSDLGPGDVLIQDNVVINRKTGGLFFSNQTTGVAVVADNVFTNIEPDRLTRGPVDQSGNVVDGVLVPPSNYDGSDPGNATPVADAGQAATSEDAAAQGTLRATDADGDALTYGLAAGGAPAHGSVTVSASGAFTYTPNANFSGNDAFTYTVRDVYGAVASAQVGIVVGAVADKPALVVENAVLGGGGAGATLVGSAKADVIAGGAGNDVLQGQGGNDTLYGDAAAAGAQAVALDITATLGDLDGSETLRVTVAGLLAGATLSGGTAGAGGTWILGAADLDGLLLTLPDGLLSPLALTVSAVSTDTGPGGPVTSAASTAILTVGIGAAGSGNDVLVGGAGSDAMYGGAGNDIFRVGGTGDGSDRFDGGAGVDRILGGTGNDVIGINGTFNAASSIETIDGGGGIDVIRGTGGNDSLNFSATSLVGIARIEGGGGRDVLVGSAGADTIAGQAGDDTMSGGAGNDTFLAAGSGEGYDRFDGGAGVDRILGGAGDDVIGFGGAFGAANVVETIDGGAGTNIIRGTGSNDSLNFSATSLARIARIEGGGGSDAIVGGAAADTIAGQAGNDTLTGGAGNDVFQFLTGGGSDTVMDFNLGDTLRFDGYAAADIAITGSGTSAIVRFDGDALQVTLRNVDPADLGYTATTGAEGPAVVVRLDDGVA